MENCKRPSWDEYFMKLAEHVAERGTCIRRKVGAVIVRDKQILTTGYNGAPRGLPHCGKDRPCKREEMNIKTGQSLEYSRATHAEQNAIAQAAMHGISVKDAIVYCTNHPCATCVKILINSGIKEIIFNEDYEDLLAKELLEESDLVVRQFKLV